MSNFPFANSVLPFLINFDAFGGQQRFFPLILDHLLALLNHNPQHFYYLIFTKAFSLFLPPLALHFDIILMVLNKN